MMATGVFADKRRGAIIGLPLFLSGHHCVSDASHNDCDLPTVLVPFSTWLLIGYFRSIPCELEKCALIDGVTRLEILRRITQREVRLWAR